MNSFVDKMAYLYRSNPQILISVLEYALQNFSNGKKIYDMPYLISETLAKIICNIILCLLLYCDQIC